MNRDQPKAERLWSFLGEGREHAVDMSRTQTFLSIALMSAACLMVVGQNEMMEEAECLSMALPEDLSDQEAIDSFLANCDVCGRKASTAATSASCTALKNQCPVPKEDLLLEMPMDMEPQEDQPAEGGEVALTTTDLVIEACANRTVEACKAETNIIAREGKIDLDCAKVLVNGPDTSISILGCNSRESASGIYSEILDVICTALLPVNGP